MLPACKAFFNMSSYLATKSITREKILQNSLEYAGKGLNNFWCLLWLHSAAILYLIKIFTSITLAQTQKSQQQVVE